LNPIITNRLAVILALAGLGIGCLLVILPFLTSLAWAVILVTSTWGIFKRLDRLFGNRRLLTFLGPVLLAVTYHLILEWTADTNK
jgi:predicted PurR-regulated permease PerM